ncbi:hypothetical protein ABZ468_07920 [Streptomyces sp. NPDC005708]|uniref:hypothetical protein n=1 Tax=Streptomyces sp. NPDC005708 TaxID=3154564 RepID=UPI0033EB8C5A
MVVDYQPMYGGAHYDPDPAGGAVSRLDLYGTADRGGPVIASSATVTRRRPGVYRFELPEVPAGRYWGMVTFTPSDGAQPVKDTSLLLDLPLGLGLVTSPEAVAKMLGVPLPITADQRGDLEAAIRNAQSDVVAYLGRPVVPRIVSLSAATPCWTDNLEDTDAWPLPEQDDIVQVSAYKDRGDGTYDAEFLVGLDGATEQPIVRYVTAHAAESERQRPGGVGSEGRRVSSVSAEGQSISYEQAPPAGQAGALPTLDSLSRLRRKLYAPLNRPHRAPFPYSGYPGRRRHYY